MPQGVFPKLPPKTPAPTRQQQEDYDRVVKEEQAKWDWKRRFAAGVLEGIGGASSLDTAGKPATAEDYGKGTVDVLTSGLPFGAFKGLMGGKVFHGSPRMGKILEEGFNPSLYNRHDTLGAMTHFAENPRYAEEFIHNKAVLPGDKPGIIPAKLDIKNAVDLYDTQNLTLEDRTRLAGLFSPGTWERDAVTNPNSTRHRLTSAIANVTPGQLKGLGIDAVRYEDIREPAWAVPEPEKIIGAYTGKPIGIKKPSIKIYELGNDKLLTEVKSLQEAQDFVRKYPGYNLRYTTPKELEK